MKNRQQPSMGGYSEFNDRTVQQSHIETSTVNPEEEQMFLDRLLAIGFDWEEAVKLLKLRDHLYENTEMRQRVADDSRMHFARWLYEQGEINEL